MANAGAECTHFADFYCELLVALLFVSVNLLVWKSEGRQSILSEGIKYIIQTAQFRHRIKNPVSRYNNFISY